jgi:acyl-CoA synthetase (AMP-forming)/AMP-acid ligase II
MTRALKSKGGNATTILLYGPGFESIASAVVSQLGHRSCCLPLKNFSYSFVQHSEVFSQRLLDSERPRQVPKSVSEKIKEIKIAGSNQDAMIVFTSGTTGDSKGVRLSHRALAIQALAKLDYPCGCSIETAMLASTVPLFHVGGFRSCLAVLFAGRSLVFPTSTSSGFDPSMVRRSLENPLVPVNTLVVVPAMLVSFLKNREAEKIFPHARLILIGGQSASESLIQKIL